MKKLLLPILPKYVSKILDGTKVVEYRTKVRKDSTVNQVLIYQSKDVRKVVAEFRIGGIIMGTPNEVWDKTKFLGGIDEKSYFKYFENHKDAYAYIISNLSLFENPIPLEELGLQKAPMGFQYVDCVD